MASIAPAILTIAGRPPGLSWRADPAVDRAIHRLGRTEDLQFSPSGRQLALVDMAAGRLLVLRTDIKRTMAGAPCIELTDFLEVASSGFRTPHGVCWLDERVLAVANRAGTVALVELPAILPGDRRIRLDPVGCLGEARADFLSAPGSVSAQLLGLDLVELLVCNNLSSQVSRHLLDRRRNYEFLMSEPLLQEGVELPDGVAHCPSGAWVAVSSHDGHCVLVYDNLDNLDLSAKPRGILRGIGYPHGVRFSADAQWLVVADAGAPFVHLFHGAQDWAGERAPAASVRVMSDSVFGRGQFSPKEGGPKGIDLNGSVLAITAQNEPLAFFDLEEIIGTGANAPVDRKAPEEAERARAAMLRYLRAAHVDARLATKAVLSAAEREVALLKGTRSWRVTAPLRRLSEAGTAFVNWRRQRRAGPRGAAPP